MAEPITMQKLIDASLDSDSLEVVVNGDENTDVNTRLGKSYPTVQKAIRLMTEMGVGFTPFESESLMRASSKPDGTYAVVTNDILPSNGVYIKKSGTWQATKWNSFIEYNSLVINDGKEYPFKKMVRDGITSDEEYDYLRAFLDITVINAEDGFYYSIGYFRNGRVIDGAETEGWTIYKHTASDYSTESDQIELVRSRDDAPKLGRDGVQTIYLNSQNNPEMFKFTLDTKALKDRGGYYAHNIPSNAMWSWIIDPNCYLQRKEYIAPVVDDKTNMRANLTSGELTLEYGSDANEYQVVIKPMGYNNLPNIYKAQTRVKGDADWVQITATTSDWLSPLGATADDGDGSRVITTGGNHGKDGSNGGGKTARNIYYAIETDGDKVSSFDGYVKNIRVTIINEVMAHNTILTDTYAVREAFTLNISENGLIKVDCNRRALLPLVMYKDRGIQSVLLGFAGTLLVTGGSVKERESIADPDYATGSGAKSIAPFANAMIFQNDGHQLSMSIDRSFALGNTDYVSDDEQLLISSTGSFKKAYTAIIIGGDGLHLDKGEGYQWRGSYHIKSASDKPSAADSQFDTYSHRVIAYNADDYVFV